MLNDTDDENIPSKHEEIRPSSSRLSSASKRQHHNEISSKPVIDDISINDISVNDTDEHSHNEEQIQLDHRLYLIDNG